jgi:hypothetical protein
VTDQVEYVEEVDEARKHGRPRHVERIREVRRRLEERYENLDLVRQRGTTLEVQHMPRQAAATQGEYMGKHEPDDTLPDLLNTLPLKIGD